ncbi:MAG: SURF1 family protein [Rhodoglobus sp.]
MKGWRFALSRRWLGYLALVVAFAIACTLLSLWQIARRDEARADIVRVDMNWDADPRPLAELLTERTGFDEELTWSPVTLTGQYLTDDQLLARGRPLNGNPGFEVLVPFQLEDGTIFIVDRGWVPPGSQQDAPEDVPAPPSGEVTVVARLKAGEPTLAGRSAPPGQVATIHLPTIAALVGDSTYTGAYGLLDSEDPAPATRPAAVVKPAPDEGPHLSYAFQWVLFGIMAFIALGWAIRQEYRIRNADDPIERERAAVRERKRAAKPRTDAEIEDDLVDAHR